MQSQISRTELYDLVWSEPLSKLAGRFGLSDNGLRIRCARHNIPLPPTGFRQRQAAGYNPEKQPLPDPDNDETIVFSTVVQDALAARLMDEVFAKLLAYEAHPSSAVQVHDDDINHPVARLVFDALEEAVPEHYGGVSYTGVCFRVRVYPQSVERASRLIGAIFRTAEQRGFLSDDGLNQLVIADKRLEFSIHEQGSRRTDVEWSYSSPKQRSAGRSSPNWSPSGLFKLYVPIGPNAFTQRSLSDKAKRPVELQIGLLMTLLIEDAYRLALDHARGRASFARVDEENARRALLHGAKEDEVLFVERLEQDAALWAKAQAIRSFAAAVAKRGGDADAATAARALLYADRLDPLTPSPESPLDWSEKDIIPLPRWWDFERDGKGPDAIAPSP